VSQTSSAPGKMILLGEHAVVFGQPAIAVAVNLRLRCRMEPATSSTLNGAPLSEISHSYVHHAIRLSGHEGPLALTTASEIPSGSGLGSSAAVSTSLLALLLSRRGSFSGEDVARKAFEVELAVQGRASPVDTSTSVHGRGVLIDNAPGENLLWRIQKDSREWYVHHCDVPRLTFVIGFTGIRASTGPLVAKVKRYHDRTVFARDIIQEIGQLTREGITRLRRGDAVGLGELMTKDHRLLTILGVSSPELDRLVSAALPDSYGAKLTGAGGGGSMIALTDRPKQVSEAIRLKGGIPYEVAIGEDGVRIEH